MSSKSKPGSRAGYMRDYRKGKKGADAPRATEIERQMREQYETAKQRLELGLKDLLPGSNSYVKIVQAITDLEREYRRERAERGLDPPQLGVGIKPSWNFVCRVGVSGAVTCTEVPADQVQSALAARAKADADHIAKMNKPGDDELRAALDREFGFNPDGSEKDQEE